MRLIWVDNTHFKIDCRTNFEISWFGYTPTLERKSLIWVGFTGCGWWGKLTEWHWLDISNALWAIKFDRNIDPSPSISNLQGESKIEGDIFDPRERSSLSFWRYEDALMIWINDTRNSIHFLIESEISEKTPSGIVVVATQKQFAQLVNLALAVQNYARRQG